MIYGLIGLALTIMVPIVLASIGAVFATRSGVMALGLESLVLTGAFGAALGADLFRDPWAGLFFGLASGILMALLYGFFAIKQRMNHVIAGMGTNLLAVALTTVLIKVIWRSEVQSALVPQLPHIKIRAFGDIPLLGALFGDRSILFYFMIIAAGVGFFLLFKTVFGLRLRTVGENPTAAATVGIAVQKYKFIGVIIMGGMSGLAGAFMSIDNLNVFTRGMSAGRGYMAMVICILGGYHPLKVLVAGFVFALASAVEIFFSAGGYPSQLIAMLPYVVTILFLIVTGRKNLAPAGIGKSVELT